ncbi:MAG: hypothetical protein RMN25_08370 [Anaerolineae bacterium]|nr:hypothetical protein [Thermoflexales bacterium]MDW8407788.1 hypothetical protein [Anaerolineae bacterium]
MKLFRPTESTRFHIDYSWFEKNGQDVRVLVYKCLTPEQQERLGDNLSEQYDYVDEMTGEVERVDRMVYMLQTESATDPNFVTPRTPVFEAAFRIFLLNRNKPLTAVELAERMGRKPSEVLAQLSGRAVYNGIRPIVE